MNYPKFQFTEEQKARFLTILLEVSTLVETRGTTKIIDEDPDDDIIIESALIGGADVIISGDKHLLKRGEYSGVRIVTASDFLDTEQ